MTTQVDALVVGSGPGGAVTARVLADAGLSVLVAEEGEAVDPGEAEPFSLDQMSQAYRGAGLTVALGRPSIAYTEARCLGGGSTVNSGFYHRPSASLLAEWSRAFGIEGLTPEVLAPHLTRFEQELSIARRPDGQLSASSDVLRRGAEELGWRAIEVPRWVRYEPDGASPVHRETMSRTYLPKAQAAGAQIWTGARVERLDVSDGRVSGARVVRGAGARPVVDLVRADHVFVCAGAIQTPALLQRSGVRRHVGANLSVHPTVKVVAEFADEINQPDDLPTYQVNEFAPRLTLGGAASRQSLIALSLADNWSLHGTALQRWRRQTVYYAAVQSTGRGRVQAIPGFGDPLVTYRLTREDAARLRAGLGRLLHLLLAAGAETLYPAFRGAPLVRDRVSAAEALARFTLGAASLMTVHLTGTAPMGEDRRRAAVDSFGRVHGYDNLWVNDASVLPWAPGINPQGTLMAIAHRNAEAFLERANQRSAGLEA